MLPLQDYIDSHDNIASYFAALTGPIAIPCIQFGVIHRYMFSFLNNCLYLLDTFARSNSLNNKIIVYI